MKKNNQDLSEKIMLGLKKAYEKMLETKRKNGGEVVVMRDGKIVKFKP